MRFAKAAVLASMLLLGPASARAACNSIPPPPSTPSAPSLAFAPGTPTPTPTPTPAFYGRMGSIDQPFPVPKNWVKVTRRSCDDGSAFPTAAGVYPRITLLIDPKVGSKSPAQALIVERQGGCDANVVKQCDLDLNNKLDGDAKCVDVPTAEYAIDAGGTTLSFKLPDPAASLTTQSGALSLAVTTRGGPAPCKNLAKKTCKEILKTGSAGWHSCIDELFENGLTCQYQDVDETFASLTLLPSWNRLIDDCFYEWKYCNSTGTELRYAIDAQGNILLPMRWQESMDQCTSRCGLWIRGDLVGPQGMWLQIPQDDQGTPGKNSFLQSFSPEGRRIYPASFGKWPTSVNGGTALRGTADGPQTVLRLVQATRLCKLGSLSTRRCTRRRDCLTGETCQRVCVGGINAGKECSVDGDCAPFGRCGKSFDLRLAKDPGRWRFERYDGAFCQEENPSQRCSSSDAPPCGGTRACVRYQLAASSPFPQPTSTPLAQPDSASLQQALGGSVEIIQAAQSADADWIAAYVRGLPPAANAARSGAGAESPIALVTARLGAACGSRQAICELSQLRFSGERPLIDRPLVLYGSKVRLLVGEPPRAEERGFWSWLLACFGKDEPAAGETRLATLEIYDGARPQTGATVIARVDLADPRYDPLFEYPSGSTLFLTRAGQCIGGDGDSLPVPSYCQPGAQPDECPPDAHCKETTVVVAVDLSTDLDSDGVPDAIRPTVQAGSARRARGG